MCRRGFSLIELITVIAILGVMSTSAVPVYQRFWRRAVRAEAKILMRELINAELLYHLEHGKFFPEDGTTSFEIFHDDPQDKPEIEQIREALKITIPVDHFLDFHFQTFPKHGHVSCTIVISAPFPLFGGEGAQLTGIVHKDNWVTIF